ncbi:hypothetical protein L6452_16156 [Arctium lappa]|uniref:Uncharacterized protein n=1 Tax=Arctium lappa TaxID=4217 RepID=A0ACB9BZZ1_ARCLA|nr:hypothetical protein L6452_16156 [Arctium lappa]
MNVSGKRGRRSQIVWKMMYLSIRKTQDSEPPPISPRCKKFQKDFNSSLLFGVLCVEGLGWWCVASKPVDFGSWSCALLLSHLLLYLSVVSAKIVIENLRNVWDFSDTDVEETVISSDIPILQEINSSELQLWVELPILDNVWYDHDDVNPTEVHNVNELLRTSSTQFVVDDDEDEENEDEYEDEQEDVLVESDSD